MRCNHERTEIARRVGGFAAVCRDCGREGPVTVAAKASQALRRQGPVALSCLATLVAAVKTPVERDGVCEYCGEPDGADRVSYRGWVHVQCSNCGRILSNVDRDACKHRSKRLRLEKIAGVEAYVVRCNVCNRDGAYGKDQTSAMDALEQNKINPVPVSLELIDQSKKLMSCPECENQTLAHVVFSGHRHRQCLYCGHTIGPVYQDGDFVPEAEKDGADEDDQKNDCLLCRRCGKRLRLDAWWLYAHVTGEAFRFACTTCGVTGDWKDTRDEAFASFLEAYDRKEKGDAPDCYGNAGGCAQG